MIHAEELLNTLFEGKDLTDTEARNFLDDVIAGALTSAQTAGILVALRMKGESASEIVGLLRGMRAQMVPVEAKGAVDIVGTGGDGSGTFNISTAAAFVAAGAGALVAKHGNRAASSKAGSADVLAALGVNVTLTKQQAEEVFKKAGIVFLMAPLFHPAMKNVIAVRKELKVRTIFNILGPFANPAGTSRQLVGVPNVAIAKKMAEAAKELGYEHLLIVTSDDGMDEISLSAKTQAFDVKGNTVKAFAIDPKTFGFKKSAKNDILGGSAEENADIIRSILAGRASKDGARHDFAKSGPRRDIVVLNAGFGLYVAGIAKTPKEGIAKAEESIDSGKAAAALEALVRETKKFAV